MINISPKEALRHLANNVGTELNEYLEDQASVSICDAFCLACGWTDQEVAEPDMHNEPCPDCKEKELYSSMELLWLCA